MQKFKARLKTKNNVYEYSLKFLARKQETVNIFACFFYVCNVAFGV